MLHNPCCQWRQSLSLKESWAAVNATQSMLPVETVAESKRVVGSGQCYTIHAASGDSRGQRSMLHNPCCQWRQSLSLKESWAAVNATQSMLPVEAVAESKTTSAVNATQSMLPVEAVAESKTTSAVNATQSMLPLETVAESKTTSLP